MNKKTPRSRELMFCPECDAKLDEVEVGLPCPTCRGNRRSAIARPQTVDVVVDVNPIGLRIRRDDLRPWLEKWADVTHSLQEVSAAYHGFEEVGNVELDQRVTRFFVECDHLRDWLIGDHASLSELSEGDVHEHFESSWSLQVCNAICNSHKHHTRRSGMTARIRETSIGPVGGHVTIEVDWASPTATTLDALDLAQQCVDSWRGFLNANGIIAL